MTSTEVVEVRRRQLRALSSRNDSTAYFVRGATELATDYDVGRIILEPGSDLAPHLARYHVETCSIAEAKTALLADTADLSQHALMRAVVREHPKLARVVTLLAATGRIAMSERRRTVALLAVAIGLAVGNGRTTTNH